MPDPVDQILLRFPGPVTFYPSRKKWILVLLISLCFVAAGVFLLQRDRPSSEFDKLMSWAGILFFGMGIPISIAAMLPNASHLKLEAGGFEAATLRRSVRVAWTEAANFEAARMSHVKFVAFDYDPQKAGVLGSIAVSLAGHNGALPDTYGFSPDDLARLMNAWRERALR